MHVLKAFTLYFCLQSLAGVEEKHKLMHMLSKLTIWQLLKEIYYSAITILFHRHDLYYRF